MTRKYKSIYGWLFGCWVTVALVMWAAIGRDSRNGPAGPPTNNLNFEVDGVRLGLARSEVVNKLGIEEKEGSEEWLVPEKIPVERCRYHLSRTQLASELKGVVWVWYQDNKAVSIKGSILGKNGTVVLASGVTQEELEQTLGYPSAYYGRSASQKDAAYYPNSPIAGANLRVSLTILRQDKYVVSSFRISKYAATYSIID